MFARFRLAPVALVLLGFAGFLIAQPAPLPPPKVDPPPARDVVAARVNGHPIPELSVYRGLMRVAPQRRDEARKDVLNYLIDNTIIDQYLLQLKIPVETREVDEHVGRVKKEALAEKQDFKVLLEKLMITEGELRTELTSALRWDKFILQQGTDKVLEGYFQANTEMFNGSRMQARHILIPLTVGKKEDAVAKLTALKTQIGAEAANAVNKLPATSDAITREKERAKTLEQAFAKAAKEVSTCPSKDKGGELDAFKRAGDMVEPFARAAFALKPYQMSDPVTTEFGYHLILATDYKPGKEVKFAEVKPFVQEVYGERLREAVLSQYRAKSKIEILPVGKK